MPQPDVVIDLDYDSPLENLFSFLGSPWCMGGCFLCLWFFCVSPGKNGAPPIWPEFPVIPFLLATLCIWSIGFWLKANYDVRYQLDSRTQQLELVRKIFGQSFKSRIAEFSQLHASAVLASWSDDKHGNRSWQYALGLITKSGKIVQVSGYSPMAPDHRAAEIAQKLGIEYFRHLNQSGKLVVRRSKAGEIQLSYKSPPAISKSVGETEVTAKGCLIGGFLLSAFIAFLVKLSDLV